MDPKETITASEAASGAAACGRYAAQPCSTVPETVISDMQARAYHRAEELKTYRNSVEELRAELNDAEEHLSDLKSDLCEVADFLQQHNPGGQEGTTWHIALGLRLNPTGQAADHKNGG